MSRDQLAKLRSGDGRASAAASEENPRLPSRNLSHPGMTGRCARVPLHWRFALTVVLFCLGCHLPALAENCSRPALRGSFLQPALGDQWTLSQWQREFKYMKEAGVEQMVIQWTADSKDKTTVYPSSLAGYTQNTEHDVVERALDAADKSGAQVYLGLQINDDWWTNYIYESAWLKKEARLATALADDLWQKYRQHPSLVGWYLPFEVDNVETTSADWDNLVAFYRTVGSHLHKLTPGKPAVISPFFNAKLGLSPSQWQAMWEYVLKRSPIDVIAVQDGVGVGHANRSELPVWFGAVKSAIRDSRPKVSLWVDTETFNRDGEPMPIRSMVSDMCAVERYVSNYVSFSFNHYLSPQQVSPLYYQTYLDYLATGEVENQPPTKPANLTGLALDPTTTQLNWTASTDNVGVAGYRIHRDGRHITTLYDAATAYVDAQLLPGTAYTYEVKAFDAAGNESTFSNTATVTTPEPRLYPTDIALSKPYTATMAANPSYPDTGGIELTDGIVDTTNYADAAWQGRATTKGYSFTIDLGAMQVIKEVRSHWLQDRPSAIFLPKQITCLISTDGVNFTAVGMVNKPSSGNDNLSLWYTLTDLSGVTGRFLQLQVRPGSNAGWTFIDEIEVRQ